MNFTGKLSYNTVDLAKAVKAGYANESIDGSGRATWTLKYLAYEKALDAGQASWRDADGVELQLHRYGHRQR